MFKYYNSNLVTKNRSYTIEQLCSIYQDKKLHPQTIRDWVKCEGLAVISNRPIIIHGAVFKDFLKKRNDNHRKPLSFEKFKCLTCKTHFVPEDKEISLYNNKNGSFAAKGKCPDCTRINNKFYKKEDEQKLRSIFFLKKPDVMTLGNSLSPSSKTNLNENKKSNLDESNTKIQGDKQIVSKTNSHINQLPLFKDYD